MGRGFWLSLEEVVGGMVGFRGVLVDVAFVAKECTRSPLSLRLKVMVTLCDKRWRGRRRFTCIHRAIILFLMSGCYRLLARFEAVAVWSRVRPETCTSQSRDLGIGLAGTKRSPQTTLHFLRARAGFHECSIWDYILPIYSSICLPSRYKPPNPPPHRYHCLATNLTPLLGSHVVDPFAPPGPACCCPPAP
jgi:hypothetical protein